MRPLQLKKVNSELALLHTSHLILVLYIPFIGPVTKKQSSHWLKYFFL